MEKKWKQLTSSVIAMATINCCQVLKHVLNPALYGSLKRVEALIYMWHTTKLCHLKNYYLVTCKF